LPGGWRVVPELAAGGLWSTPADLAKLLILIARAYRGERNPLMSKKTSEEMMTPQGGGPYGLGGAASGSGSTPIMARRSPRRWSDARQSFIAGRRSERSRIKRDRNALGHSESVLHSNADSILLRLIRVPRMELRSLGTDEIGNRLHNEDRLGLKRAEMESMTPFLVSAMIFSCIFGAAIAGMLLRPFLKEHHLSDDSRETLKAARGVVAGLTALTLGLLSRRPIPLSRRNRRN